MLATFKNVIFPGHNHLLTTSVDNLHSRVLVIISVGSTAPVVSRWLRPGNWTFLEVASMVVT